MRLVQARRLSAALAALALCVLTLAAGPVRAQKASLSDAELLSALENSYWIAATKPSPRKVYVIASPWCPVCAQLHEYLVKAAPAVEYRFILTGPHSQEDRVKIGRAAFSRSPANLAKIYGRSPAPQEPLTPAESFAEGVNEALMTAIKPTLTARAHGRSGFPTLIFRAAGKLYVLPGLPSASNLATISTIMEPLKAPSKTPAQLASLLAAPPKLTPIDPTRMASAVKDGVILRIAPDPAAAKLAELKAGAGYVAKAETELDGERWYAFQFAKDGPPAAYGKASEFR